MADPAVKPDGRISIGLVVVAAAVAAFALFLLFSMSKLVEVERDTHTRSNEGVVWAVAQAQYEIQRLISATNPLNSPSAADVALRFDMALSRLALLQEGAFAQRIGETGGASVIARARASLEGLDSLIASSGDTVSRYSLRLSRTMTQHVVALGSVANEIMIDSTLREADRRQRYSETLTQVIVAIIGTTLTGAFLIGRLIVSLRQADRAEARVRQERNFLALLMEASGEGICAFDATGNCTHWNEGMSRLYGTARETVIGTRLPAAPALGEHFPLTAALVNRTLAGESRDFATRAGERHIEHSIRPIQLKGQNVGGILVSRDVTERYQAQHERQLREVYRDFVAMVSHQFRTPLAIIDSTVQRIMRRRDRMDNDELMARAGAIRAAASSLTQLMDSTLSAARLDAGELALSIHPIPLASLLAQVRAKLLVLEPHREITLDIADLPDIPCDALLIEQVLGNLIGNALKYSPDDTPVTVTTSAHSGFVAISISDSGLGVPEAERTRLFERFFRASNAGSVPGTGVGLYVARQIAQLHGGDIAMAPNPGGGTTFTLTLPVTASYSEAMA
ncbi:PAS domain S-box protein [Devosia sp. D6-9]|nr:PAS domain S-box protein [Devosia sp. D6-9]